MTNPSTVPSVLHTGPGPSGSPYCRALVHVSLNANEFCSPRPSLPWSDEPFTGWIFIIIGWLCIHTANTLSCLNNLQKCMSHPMTPLNYTYLCVKLSHVICFIHTRHRSVPSCRKSTSKTHRSKKTTFQSLLQYKKNWERIVLYDETRWESAHNICNNYSNIWFICVLHTISGIFIWIKDMYIAMQIDIAFNTVK